MTARNNSATPDIIPQEIIERKIFYIRGNKVMLDSDLASLYGVETKYLKRAVRRNIERFPADFMFRLTRPKYNSLRCQFGTLEKGAHTKYLPYVFTEHGVAMLSSILNSPKAVQINIQIIRAFIRIRKLLLTHKDLQKRINDLEEKLAKKMEEKFGVYDKQFQIVFQAFEEIKLLLAQPVEKLKRKIGFHP
jgi:phage regulator Rha-like protein